VLGSSDALALPELENLGVEVPDREMVSHPV
jgi:hypothetical protein